MSDPAWLRFLDILDTAVKVALGAVIASTSGFLVEAYRRRQQLVREAEQRYRDNIEKPVVGFVDEMLTLMSRAYWNKADGRDPETGSMIEVFREKEASIEARVKAMGRPDVEKYFRALDNSYVQFRAALPDGPSGKARDLLKDAHSVAGKLLAAVYPKDS
jgi:hypothetical protein